MIIKILKWALLIISIAEIDLYAHEPFAMMATYSQQEELQRYRQAQIQTEEQYKRSFLQELTSLRQEVHSLQQEVRALRQTQQPSYCSKYRKSYCPKCGKTLLKQTPQETYVRPYPPGYQEK